MKRGFTLIELLVVVLIIGILAAIALPKYEMSVAKTRLQEAIVISKALKDAQERYFLATGAYPEKFADMDIDIPNAAIISDPYGTDTITSGPFIYQLAAYVYPSFVRFAGQSGIVSNMIFHFRERGDTRCYAYSASPHFSKQAKLCMSLGGVRDSSIDTADHQAYRL